MKRLQQFPVGLIHCLGYYLDISQHRHEVGIAIPPGHDVGMDMLVNPGASYPAQVHSDVEVLGFELSLEQLDAAAHQQVMLVSLLIGQLF